MVRSRAWALSQRPGIGHGRGRERQAEQSRSAHGLYPGKLYLQSFERARHHGTAQLHVIIHSFLRRACSKQKATALCHKLGVGGGGEKRHERKMHALGFELWRECPAASEQIDTHHTPSHPKLASPPAHFIPFHPANHRSHVIDISTPSIYFNDYPVSGDVASLSYLRVRVWFHAGVVAACCSCST